MRIGDALAEAALLAPPHLGLVAVGEGEVGGAEPAAGRRAVHDVVVDEGEGLEELERRPGVDDERGRRASPPAPTKPQ